MNPFNRANWSGLDAASKNALKAILRSPAVVQAMEANEKEEIDKRLALIATLDGLPAKYEQSCLDARLAVQKAEDLVQRLQNELVHANIARQVAVVHSMSQSAQLDRAIANVTREIEDGADPRILAFVSQLRNIFDAIRLLPLNFVFVRHSGQFGASKDVLVERVQEGTDAALEALGVARVRALDLRMQALSRAEVTAALRDIADNMLRRPLAKIKLSPPRVLDSCVLEPGGTTAHAAMPGEIEEPLMH